VGQVPDEIADLAVAPPSCDQPASLDVGEQLDRSGLGRE
jgi:hypothetical protein